MNYIFLDGNKIKGIDEVYEIFAKDLSFPDYFGKNLDALHDCLVEITYPVRIVVVNKEEFTKALGRKAKGFFRLLDNVAEENDSFELKIEPFED